MRPRRLAYRASGAGSLFSFCLTAHIGERIPLLQSTGSLRNEGAPRVGLTRGRFVSYRHNRSGQRMKTGNNEIKSPTRKPGVWATQFVPPLSVRATHLVNWYRVATPLHPTAYLRNYIVDFLQPSFISSERQEKAPCGHALHGCRSARHACQWARFVPAYT